MHTMPILILYLKESCPDVLAVLLAITVGRKGAPWTPGASGWNVCVTLSAVVGGSAVLKKKSNN